MSDDNEGICYIHANRRIRVVVYFIPTAITLYEYLNRIIFILLFVFFQHRPTIDGKYIIFKAS